ncbi:MAG: hypothetical protein FH749_09885 [Firmicutes bacterium]|nr:hypothetical protein [Bacillota bacterium]
MLSTFIKHELKNILREKMTVVMLIYPLILGGVGRLLVHQEIVEGQGIGITALLMTLFAGFIFGAMAGFSLLDDRDDQVLSSIQISPVPVQWYIWFKIIFAFILAIFAGLFMILFTDVLELSFGHVLLLTTLSALQTPIVAFFINAFSQNKVEGFVTMKGFGFTLLFPVAGFFFTDAVEWVFGIAPAHWAAKAVQYSLMEPLIDMGMAEMNLGFYQYIGIGFIYNLVLVAVAYNFFRKKNDL